MNGMFIGPCGSLVQYPFRLVMSRWGGGAEQGKTHVFSIWPLFGGSPLSVLCVTDDFGNLVRVA